MYMRNALGVVSALCFVEHEQVLWRDWMARSGMLSNIVLDGLDEGPAAATRDSQRILQNLNKGALPDK